MTVHPKSLVEDVDNPVSDAFSKPGLDPNPPLPSHLDHHTSSQAHSELDRVHRPVLQDFTRLELNLHHQSPHGMSPMPYETHESPCLHHPPPPSASSPITHLNHHDLTHHHLRPHLHTHTTNLHPSNSQPLHPPPLARPPRPRTRGWATSSLLYIPSPTSPAP